MENLNLNQILKRENIYSSIKETLVTFEKNKNDVYVKKGIYIYGNPGSGKSTFVNNILKEINYDIVKYDACDNRNTSVIEDIAKHNMSDKNIMSIFNKNIKKIAIVMDEIDGMNNGDKGGINTLIKLIRPKKTKKQKLEEITMNPIICIGNYKIDKKIKELIKVCSVFELKTPTEEQIMEITMQIMPNNSVEIQQKIVEFVQGDLRKLQNIYHIYKNNPTIFTKELFDNIFQIKYYNDDAKKITSKLINQQYKINEHIHIMNETDRTSIGLLWHENIIDVLDKVNKDVAIPFYIKQLDNICLSDYIDRITFQKQIWQFNEMSSLIKTFKNNKLYHEFFSTKKEYKNEIRFTKVLTKYSTEYNNSLFIQKLCQKMGMDKKDLFGFFMDLKNKYDDNEILTLFENYEITKLDINRIYRYLEKYLKEDATGMAEKEIDCEEEIEEMEEC
jgi:DNA polymerase III delta prime subunit